MGVCGMSGIKLPIIAFWDGGYIVILELGPEQWLDDVGVRSS